jgi:hypothetical protein
MKTSITTAALIFLAGPTWAQNATQPAPHDHQAASPPSAPGSDKEAPKMGMKPGMMEHKADMAAHCQMMHKKLTGKDAAKPMDNDMKCHAMHQAKDKSGGATPKH